MDYLKFDAFWGGTFFFLVFAAGKDVECSWEGGLLLTQTLLQEVLARDTNNHQNAFQQVFSFQGTCLGNGGFSLLVRVRCPSYFLSLGVTKLFFSSPNGTGFFVDKEKDRIPAERVGLNGCGEIIYIYLM